MSGCQVVIHLAAAQHEANVPDAYFFDVNVNGTRTLLEAGKAAGVQRFVYGSTIGIYGESKGRVLDENTAPNPVNVYGRSKWAAEQLVNSYRESLPLSIVRISETYGPGDFRLLKLFKAVNSGRFMIIGSGMNRRQAILIAIIHRLQLRFFFNHLVDLPHQSLRFGGFGQYRDLWITAGDVEVMDDRFQHHQYLGVFLL